MDKGYGGIQTVDPKNPDKNGPPHPCYLPHKARRGQPLTEEQKHANRRRSTIRTRVEHPFAFMEQSLGGIYNRCIGLVRNTHQIGMMNLAYNLCRSAQLLRVTA